MHLYLTLTKRRLAAVFAVLLVCILLGGELYSASSSVKNGDTHRRRTDFISNLGYTLKSGEEAMLKEIIIPTEFSAVYNNYNELQKSAGYDLKPYSGCRVKAYSYVLKSADGNSFANLLVYKGRIIGGDISSHSLNGEMLPLKRMK